MILRYWMGYIQILHNHQGSTGEKKHLFHSKKGGSLSTKMTTSNHLKLLMAEFWNTSWRLVVYPIYSCFFHFQCGLLWEFLLWDLMLGALSGSSSCPHRRGCFEFQHHYAAFHHSASSKNPTQNIPGSWLSNFTLNQGNDGVEFNVPNVAVCHLKKI